MKRITFMEACLLWEEQKAKEVKATTMAAYSLTIQNHLMPRFRYMDEITEESMQSFVDGAVGKGLRLNTIKGMLLVLKMILRFAAHEGIIPGAEFKVRLPKRDCRPNPQVLPLDEQKLLTDWLEEHYSTLNLGIMLCIFCGLRIGEVCALKRDDIDLRAGTLTVRRKVYRIYDAFGTPRKSRLVVGLPKSVDSWRELPLPANLAELLTRVVTECGDNRFLLSGTDRPTDPMTFRNNFGRICDSLGIPRRKVHSLRHTFATRCVESKCDYKTLSALLGHSNVSTTLNIYVHPDLNQKRRCVEDMLAMVKR